VGKVKEKVKGDQGGQGKEKGKRRGRKAETKKSHYPGGVWKGPTWAEKQPQGINRWCRGAIRTSEPLGGKGETIMPKDKKCIKIKEVHREEGTGPSS